MKKVIVTCALVMIAGVLTKVETVEYPSGAITLRIYDKPQDVVPSELVWVRVRNPKPINPESVIQHREVELYNYWMKPC